MTIEVIAEQLTLMPHPASGYFKETLRIKQNVCRIEKDGGAWSASYSAGPRIY